MSFSASTRVLSGTPTATQSAATYTYKVRDRNGDEATDEFTIAVEEDTSPTLAATSDQSWFKDAAVSLTLPAASNGNEPLTYTLTGTLPTGVSFSASTRVLSGTPTATQSAETYTYKVRDRDGDEATDVFTIAVAIDSQPSLPAVGDRNWVKGDVTKKWLPEANSGNTPLTYTLSGTLPTGMTFDASTRLISGTPSAAQTAKSYTYKVRDADGDEATSKFSITVVTDPLASVDAQSWLTDTAVSLTLPKATGGNVPLTYSIGGTLPTGVSFNASSRVVSGTPTSTQTAKTYTYKVRGWNGNEHVEKFTITVTDNTPTLGSVADQNWVKDLAVSITLPAASGGDTPLTYSLAGDMPTGVSFDASSRVLSGTPTATQNAKTYTYKVEDANGSEVTDEFTIAVENDSSPTLSATSDQTWVEDAAVALTLPAASGGNSPLTYTLAGQPADGGELQRLDAGGVRHADGDAERGHLHLQGARTPNGDEASDSFTITVEDDTSPSLTSTNDQRWFKDTRGHPDTACSQQRQHAADLLADRQPADGGELQHASTRVVSGTPTATQNATTYTYKVEDRQRRRGQRQLHDHGRGRFDALTGKHLGPNLGQGQRGHFDAAGGQQRQHAADLLAGGQPPGGDELHRFHAGAVGHAHGDAERGHLHLQGRRRQRGRGQRQLHDRGRGRLDALPGQHFGPDLGQGQRGQPDAAGGQQRQHAADVLAGREPANGSELQRLHAGAVGHADGDAERHHLHLQGRGPPTATKCQRQLHDHGRGRLDALAWAAPRTRPGSRTAPSA